MKDISEIIKNYSTVLAAIAAAGFFGWKLIAGWLVVNLEIDICVSRKRFDPKHDWIDFKITLKKGNTDTLQLKDVSVRISHLLTHQTLHTISFEDLLKLKVDDGKKINWISLDIGNEMISLSPGESIPLSRAVMVDLNAPVLIEVAVFGNRAFWRKKGFQWRASATCLVDENGMNKKS